MNQANHSTVKTVIVTSIIIQFTILQHLSINSLLSPLLEMNHYHHSLEANPTSPSIITFNITTDLSWLNDPHHHFIVTTHQAFFQYPSSPLPSLLTVPTQHPPPSLQTRPYSAPNTIEQLLLMTVVPVTTIEQSLLNILTIDHRLLNTHHNH